MSSLPKIIFLLALFFYDGEISGKEKIDYPLLRDTICDSIETPGEKYPDFSVGKVVNQTGGLPWGRCQLKYWTAVRAGFSLNRNPGDLFEKDVNKEFSLKILHLCKKDLIRNKIAPTILRVAHCYGSGYLRRYPKSEYSKKVLVYYKQNILKRMKKEREQVLDFSRLNYVLSLKVSSKNFEFTMIPDTIARYWGRAVRLFLANHGIKNDNFLWEI